LAWLDLPWGGYGPLTGAYGLAADNLLSAQVTADGQLITANAEEHPDLCGDYAVAVATLALLFPGVSPASTHNRVIGMLLYPLGSQKCVRRLTSSSPLSR